LRDYQPARLGAALERVLQVTVVVVRR
jgi:hypothetical protein